MVTTGSGASAASPLGERAMSAQPGVVSSQDPASLEYQLGSTAPLVYKEPTSTSHTPSHTPHTPSHTSTHVAGQPIAHSSTSHGTIGSIGINPSINPGLMLARQQQQQPRAPHAPNAPNASNASNASNAPNVPPTPTNPTFSNLSNLSNLASLANLANPSLLSTLGNPVNLSNLANASNQMNPGIQGISLNPTNPALGTLVAGPAAQTLPNYLILLLLQPPQFLPPTQLPMQSEQLPIGHTQSHLGLPEQLQPQVPEQLHYAQGHVLPQSNVNLYAQALYPQPMILQPQYPGVYHYSEPLSAHERAYMPSSSKQSQPGYDVRVDRLDSRDLGRNLRDRGRASRDLRDTTERRGYGDIRDSSRPGLTNTHGKNISIASHFDMFLLHDKPLDNLGEALVHRPGQVEGHRREISEDGNKTAREEDDRYEHQPHQQQLLQHLQQPLQQHQQHLHRQSQHQQQHRHQRDLLLPTQLAYVPLSMYVSQPGQPLTSQMAGQPLAPQMAYYGLKIGLVYPPSSMQQGLFQTPVQLLPLALNQHQMGLSSLPQHNQHNILQLQSQILQEQVPQLTYFPQIPASIHPLTLSPSDGLALALALTLGLGLGLGLFGSQIHLSRSASSPLREYKHKVPSTRPSLLVTSDSYKSDKRRLYDDLDLLPHAKSVFKQLLVEVLDVNAYNFYGFLVRMLQLCKAHIPLDDFYRLLYTESELASSGATASGSVDSTSEGVGNKIDKRPAEEGTADVMNVCHRILEIFKEPKASINAMPGANYEKTKLVAVNYHELLRSFLALKIIMDALVISDPRTKDCATTPRLTIYKVYYILCQKLFLKYPSVFNALSEQKLILGPSKLGKLIKAMYPNIVAKRLGRRGYSKYHYMGLSLSPDLVTDEIDALCTHEIEELTEMFQNVKDDGLGSSDVNRDALNRSGGGLSIVGGGGAETGSHHDNLVRDTSGAHSFQLRGLTATFLDKSGIITPPCSFIKSTCMFPANQLSPVFCFDTPHAPKDTLSWFYLMRQESFDSLLKLNVDMTPFTDDFALGAALENSQEWLMNNVILLLEKLSQLPHFNNNHYLHVFLFVLVWVFPVMLCLDMSKSDAFLFHLRANIHNLVLNFEEKYASNAYVSASHLKSFVGILNKILNLDDVANSLFKAKRAPAVIEEMFEDIDGLVRPLLEDDGTSVLERLFSYGLVDCLNAYQFVPMMEHGAATDSQIILLVNSVAERMKSSIVHGLQDLVKKVDSVQEQYESGMEAKATRFEYLRLCLGFCHESCFDDVLVQRFTVGIINSYLLLTSNQIMKYIFHTQNQRALMVLNTTFRHWWVVLSFLQEYCGVVLETVGIHHSLNNGK